MKAAIAQIAPVFLDRDRTLQRVADAVRRAGAAGCELVCFGEALVPGYPVWLSRTGGARFDAPDQKELFALYSREAVSIERGHLEPIRDAARQSGATVVLGIVERPADRGGHSLFCSLVIINGRPDLARALAPGQILSVHRKLMPTYEERLVWAPGDAAGLVTHPQGDFTLGALNCWENWMPLARAALQLSGEDLHVMLWPGSRRLTADITRFAAREGRSYVLSAGAILRESDIPASVPSRAAICSPDELLYDGGSCVAGPDGEWIVEPVVGREDLLIVDLDPAKVRQERQNFDPAGHYSRPELLSLRVSTRRHTGFERSDAQV